MTIIYLNKLCLNIINHKSIKMKKILLLVISLFFLTGISAQIVAFHPVKVSANQLESFLDIETNYMKKIAQKAVENGDLLGWRLLETFNPGSDDFNYMFVNIYKDFNAATSTNANWWNKSEEVVGVKPNILLDVYSGLEFDRRYFYEVKQQIPNTQQASYVILNFARPNDVSIHMNETEKYVIPHFKKNMKKFGMVGWGFATKITPQGKEYSSMMTWDSYDNLSNVMKHFAGYGVMDGLPYEKFSKIIDWENRYIMKVISATK